jgi:hypothetical protein
LTDEAPVTRSAKTWLAVALMVIVPIAFNIAFLRKVLRHRPPPGTVDRVTRAEQRFDPIRSELPATGRVGYVLKVKNPRMLDWYEQYGLFFAQYSLAPLVVEKDADHELLLEDRDEGVRVLRRGAR